MMRQEDGKRRDEITGRKWGVEGKASELDERVGWEAEVKGWDM